MEVDPEALIKCTTITPGGVASSTPSVQGEKVLITLGLIYHHSLFQILEYNQSCFRSCKGYSIRLFKKRITCEKLCHFQ